MVTKTRNARVFTKSGHIISVSIAADERCSANNMTAETIWTFKLRGWFRSGWIWMAGDRIDFIELN